MSCNDHTSQSLGFEHSGLAISFFGRMQCFRNNTALAQHLTALPIDAEAQLLLQADRVDGLEFNGLSCGVGNGGALCITTTLLHDIQVQQPAMPVVANVLACCYGGHSSCMVARHQAYMLQQDEAGYVTPHCHKQTLPLPSTQRLNAGPKDCLHGQQRDLWRRRLSLSHKRTQP
jgi:hypothetical protein